MRFDDPRSEGYFRIAQAVFLLAVRDASRGDPLARLWLLSEDAALYREIAEVGCATIETWLEAGAIYPAGKGRPPKIVTKERQYVLPGM